MLLLQLSISHLHLHQPFTFYRLRLDRKASAPICELSSIIPLATQFPAASFPADPLRARQICIFAFNPQLHHHHKAAILLFTNLTYSSPQSPLKFWPPPIKQSSPATLRRDLIQPQLLSPPVILTFPPYIPTARYPTSSSAFKNGPRSQSLLRPHLFPLFPQRAPLRPLFPPYNP